MLPDQMQSFLKQLRVKMFGAAENQGAGVPSHNLAVDTVAQRQLPLSLSVSRPGAAAPRRSAETDSTLPTSLPSLNSTFLVGGLSLDPSRGSKTFSPSRQSKVLGWPRNSFGFSIGCYKKTQINFLANPVAKHLQTIIINLKQVHYKFQEKM